MYELLRRNRLRLGEELRDSDRRRFFSPSLLSEYEVTLPRIIAHVNGKIIDLGCGDMPFRKFVVDKVGEYHSLDIEKKVADVMFVGDIQDMNMIPSETYDSAICLQVLNYVANPFKALSEIQRILRKDGRLILSVCHLSRILDEPYDLYRYTNYGLKYLLEEAGFKVMEIVPTGGIFCFLGHQFSTIFVCLFWHIPVLKNVVFFLNKWFCAKLCFWLDKNIEKRKVLALGYTCVAKKK
jgi:SAM-dependent methyltransferase